MVDIFLSYAVKDREVAYRIAELLESSGWTVWWDQRIPAGARWRSAINDALGNMRCMVVLWSRNSITSQWVTEEAEQARLAGKLVPVLIDPVRPPIGFRELQYSDLSNWDGSPDAPAFRQLVLDIEALLGRSVAPRTRTMEARTTESTDAEAGWNGRWRFSDSTVEDGHPREAKSGRKIAIWLLAATIVLATGAALMLPARNWRTPMERNAPALTEPPTTGVSPTSPEADKAREEPAQTQPGGETATAPESAPKRLVPPIAPTGPTVKKPVQQQLPRTSSERDQRDTGPTSGASRLCGDILHRLQLGEVLSDEDWRYLHKECR
jgi:hypothetical protein